MTHRIENQLTFELANFILDRRAKRRSETTIRFYHGELNKAFEYFRRFDVEKVEDITARMIRSYLVELGKTRNDGGVHAAYRSIKAFLNWWDEEIEPVDWRNPIDRVRGVKRKTDIQEGIPLEVVQTMADLCGKDFCGRRDRAILLSLVETGARRQEFVNLNIGDVDFNSGAVYIHNGKGGKSRTTFMGAAARREVNRYLRMRKDRTDHQAPLWVTFFHKRLTADGLRQVVRRRAEQAGLEEEPGLHDFRRTFALERLRNGCDIYSLMYMMGHSQPDVLQRYLRLVESDLQRAHEGSSPLDHA